jgi:hypothetical protein
MAYNCKSFECLSRPSWFQTLEQESKWVAAVPSGRTTLPSDEDMMASAREHYQLMEETGRTKCHTHTLSPQWVSQR